MNANLKEQLVAITCAALCALSLSSPFPPPLG